MGALRRDNSRRRGERQIAMLEPSRGLRRDFACDALSRECVSYFDSDSAIMRMLVVDPAARGDGIPRGLAQECLARARRDGAATFALHTARIIEVASAMYERMGFAFLRDAPVIFGVPYGIYVKPLHAARRQR